MRFKAAIAILLIAWCGRAVAQVGTGKIIFYRESHFLTADFKAQIFCDGVELERVANGSYLEVIAPPGRHTCVAESLQGPPTTIDIVPGTVAYLRVDITRTTKRHAFLITTTESEYEAQDKLKQLPMAHLTLAQHDETPIKSVQGSLLKKEAYGRSAKFGDLNVTAANLENTSFSDFPDRRAVALFLTVDNTGSSPACASFTAKLKTTFGFEYLGISGQAPAMRSLLPGESALGSYLFDVKDGVQPEELILDLDGGTIRCKISSDASLHDVSIPDEIRLDVRDLPEISSKDRPPAGTFLRADGTTHPQCIFCPDPQYTKQAINANLEGTVQQQALIGTDGKATDIRILKGIGQGMDEQAVNTVRTWRFRPAVNSTGDPVAITVPIEIVFSLLKQNPRPRK